MEHVLAKSGGSGRVVDATNLALACGGGTWAHHTHESRFAKPIDANMSCGQKKDALDLGNGCDPRTFPTWARLTKVDVLGVISADVAACSAVGVDPAAGLAVLAQSRLRPDGAGHLRAFWSVWRQYLEPASEDWVAANHALL